MQSENPLLNFGCTFLKLFKLGGRGGRGSKRGKTSALYDRAAGRGGGGRPAAGSSQPWTQTPSWVTLTLGQPESGTKSASQGRAEADRPKGRLRGQQAPQESSGALLRAPPEVGGWVWDRFRRPDRVLEGT